MKRLPEALLCSFCVQMLFECLFKCWFKYGFKCSSFLFWSSRNNLGKHRM